MAGGSSTRFLSEAHGRVGRWLRNKWHLDSLIAIGGMAAVYASTHRNGARAAIKLLHSQYTRNEQARRRFLAEGYAANKVGHRNAVLVLDDDTTEDGEVYLVMELLEGESLEGRLERLGVMGPMEVLQIADQLLEVLACAHPKGILHRDIKPANIYLTRDGSVKLLDFGLARVRELSAEALDQSDGIVFGTVSYIAPEQARADNQNLDSRSDMWSIAATMFRALAGETVHPSTGPIIERLLAVARKPARSIASLAPHLPRPLIELVDRALAFDPEDRWPSANVMRVVVQDVMAQLQEQAESDEIDVEVQQPTSSRRNNTLPVTTRARTLDLPTVRPGGGQSAAESGVTRPKTDPIGLSHRPRNLPPSEPAPPDGDETELDLDGLYDKARPKAPTNPGRSRTLLTKEGRAELRRILDARRAGTSSPEPEAEPAPRRARRVAGPDTSGVGDIEVEFEDAAGDAGEDSIIEVTIDHSRAARSGPIAVRLSEPSSATPAPVQPEPPAPVAATPTIAEPPGEPNAVAAASSTPEGEAYPISVEDEDDESEAAFAEEEDEVASPAPPSAASKPTSNLRPPSVPPHLPVSSDSRGAAPQPPASPARATGRAPQAEITRVGPPPRPASSEPRPASREPRPASSEPRPASSEPRPASLSPAASSLPATAAGAREITKVGPAPVAPATPATPAAPPARDSLRPQPRANAGLLHETMRAAAPVAPPTRGSRDETRPGASSGLLNETLRPGAAPPPTQARSGPLPVARVEGEPVRSTTFAAPSRPGSEAPSARATNFVPPSARAAIVPPATTSPAAPTPAAPAAMPTASSPATPTASSPPGAVTTMRLPTAVLRPTAQPSTTPTNAPSPSPSPGVAATNKATTSPTPGVAATNKATTSPTPNKAAPGDAAMAQKPATNESAVAPSKVASDAAAPNKASDTSPNKASDASANKPTSAAISSKASDAATTRIPGPGVASPAASKATSADPAAKLASPTASKPVTGTDPARPVASPSKPAPGNLAAKPATAVPVPIVPTASGPLTVPVVPGVSVPVAAPVVPAAPVAVPVVPARSAPAAPSAPVAAPAASKPPEPALEWTAEVAAPAEPTPARAGKSVFNPYPSLAGGSTTAKTASYATVPAGPAKDSAVVSPNPRTSPNAKTAPHAAADPTPVPQDSSQSPRAGSPTAKTAAYATVGAGESKPAEPARSPTAKTAAYPTVGAEESKPAEPSRSPVKTGAVPVLPFNFLRGGAKPGEPGEPEDPKNPGRKKP